jgi:hypothetical protein
MAQCNAHDDAAVAVDIQHAPVETVFDTSLDELDRIAREAGKEAHAPLMAVYTSATLFTADIDMHVSRMASNVFCAGANSVRVRIAVGRRTIHVARELREKACLQKAAIEHVEAHARIQEQVLAGMESTIAANVKTRLREASANFESAADADRKLRRAIDDQINADLNDADKAKTIITSRDIDSPESLARLRAACSDERGNLFNNRI